MQRRDVVFVLAGLVAFAIGVRIYDATRQTSFAATNGRDVREVYCAGRVVLARADPYRVEPLRTCLHAVEPRDDPAWAVTPAPLPGYDFLAAAALSTLPYPVAKSAWEMTLVACVLVAALALARLVRRSDFVALAVLMPTVGFLNLAYGEPTPLVVAALCVGALALERGAVVLPACCAGIALVEPHVGLPALLALAISMPRARWWATGVGISLGVASAAVLGLGANVAYVRVVLPLQALAEIAANDQYSLAHLLAVAGVAPKTAILLGSLSYVIVTGVGIAVAVRLARTRRPAYALLLPPAAAVLGGTYVHDVQIAVAIPCALLLAVDVPRLRARSVAAATLLLLPATSYHLRPFPVSAVAALVAMLALGRIVREGRSRSERRLIVCAQALVVAAVVPWMWLGIAAVHRAAGRPPVVATASAPRVAPDDYASVAWLAYLNANGESTRPSPRYVVEKLPAWFALIALLCCAGAYARLPERRGLAADLP